MKHKLFFLLWCAMLAFVSVIVGVLALLGFANAEVVFWTQTPIRSEAGKIVWIVISATCLIVFSVLAAIECRKGKDRSST